MRNAGFHELRPFLDKAEASVEAAGLRLRMQGQIPLVLPVRLFQQSLQQCAADTLAAPIRPYRHAAKLTIRQQTAGTDGDAAAVAGDHMTAHRIAQVALDVARNLLLIDKHRVAHQACRLSEFLPRPDGDAELDNIDRRIQRDHVE